MLPAVQRRSRFLLVDAFRRWREIRGAQLGAALAFYALLSFGPLFSIIVAGSGAVVGEETARRELVRQLTEYVGERGAAPIVDVLRDMRPFRSTAFGAAAVTAILLWGAHLVFSQLKASLNVIWGVTRPRHPVLGFMVARLAALAMILLTMGLLTASVILTAALSALDRWAPHRLPAPASLLQALDFIVTVGLATLLLAAIYKLLPDAHVHWSDVWSGAFWTSVLLVAGKSALGFYLSHTHLDSIYGAAVGAVAILVGIFVYAELLLFGALLTALRAGRRR